MQIAIVDDRAEDREELSACLENYMKKHQLDYTLTEFEDGENFLKAAAQVDFQLVFYAGGRISPTRKGGPWTGLKSGNTTPRQRPNMPKPSAG